MRTTWFIICDENIFSIQVVCSWQSTNEYNKNTAEEFLDDELMNLSIFYTGYIYIRIQILNLINLIQN